MLVLKCLINYLIMNRDEILNTIKSLASSQGFYGRLYEQLYDNDDALEYLERQNFQDPVDMILFFEQ